MVRNIISDQTYFCLSIDLYVEEFATQIYALFASKNNLSVKQLEL